MNSEELENSLRTEFEVYLKGVSKMRDEASEFQKKIEGELESQRAQFDPALREFNSLFEGEHKFDAGFSETVGEHLRLARDEGSQIAANALAEAESFREQEVLPQPTDYTKLNEAIKDISSQQSPATILKSLVSHAGEFASRGAFFIVKHEHFVGWKTLGGGDDDSAVQDIDFPISSSSVLGRAVNTLAIADGSYDPDSDDRTFLEPLRFGQPAKMYAIPLTARGRGVAVLYVDSGAEGREPDLAALEALVRVAGMTVEVQASEKSAAAPAETGPEPETPPQITEESPIDAQPTFETNAPVVEEAPSADFSFGESSAEAEEAPQASFDQVEEFAPRGFDPDVVGSSPEAETARSWSDESSFEAPQVDDKDFDAPQAKAIPEAASEPVTAFEPSPFSVPTVPSFAEGVVTAPPLAPVATEVPRSRLSHCNVDLPIDVAEDESRLHYAARHFARLLVSEIKLYNAQKVKDGRESSDLYDRLREAIDRSREIYEKRVQPPVAARFDYFHYELVNSLGDGEATRLGSSYPGASV